MSRKNSYITVTDQFCGAGGSSQGVRNLSKRLGGGLEVKLALNHWELAIRTHNTNFPETDHDCTDISACDPRRYKSTDILITSPECTNHSLAKGRKRKWQHQLDMFGKLDISAEDERSRATMWDVPRFAEFHDYNAIIVENVVDARYWKMWDAWLHAMHSLGYNHECVYLNSMHAHPTPQSRDRMYVVFWKKGNKSPDLEYRPISNCATCGDVHAIQSWRNPMKKWGKYKQQYDYRCPKCASLVEPYYYAAFNIIDWSIPAQRIGDRSKPLAENTIRRIKHGLEKYGKKPLVITTRYTTGLECRVKDATSNPLPTQPGDPSHFLLSPFTIGTSHTHAGDKYAHGIDEAVGTQCTKASTGLVVPGMLVKNYGGGFNPKLAGSSLSGTMGTATTSDHHGILGMPMVVDLKKNGRCHSSDEQISTVVASGYHHGILQAPYLVENNGLSNSRGLNDRMGCITTKDKVGLLSSQAISAFLSYHYGGSDQVSSMDKAIGTCTTKDRHALLMTPVPNIDIEDCTYRMLKPHEIQRGMAFADDYIVLGNSAEKVKQLGNAVTPPAMEWLVQQVIQSLS